MAWFNPGVPGLGKFKACRKRSHAQFDRRLRQDVKKVVPKKA
jgi:hypothetical protein